MKDKIKQIFKNKKAVIAIWVAGISMLTIGVSYAAFFRVKSNSSNQTVTTGNLAVTYGDTLITRVAEMMPMNDDEGMAQTTSKVVYIQNTGNVDVNYILNIGYDMTNFLADEHDLANDTLTPIKYIRVAVFDYNDQTTPIAGPVSLADLPIYSMTNNDSNYARYSLMFSSIAAEGTKTYIIKTWLSTEAKPSASDSYFYVNSEIVAEPDESKMAYTAHFYLRDSSSHDPIEGAVVSLHNGSATASSSSTGLVTFEGLLSDTYNLNITYNGDTYKGNMTIVESNASGLTSPSTFTLESDTDLVHAAYTYKTTINNLITANSLATTSSTYTLSSGSTYNLLFTPTITGTANQTIGRYYIDLNTTTKRITGISLYS